MVGVHPEGVGLAAFDGEGSQSAGDPLGRQGSYAVALGNNSLGSPTWTTTNSSRALVAAT